MFEARHQDNVTIIRGVGELTKDELSAIKPRSRGAHATTGAAWSSISSW
jgi:hypothetical protein